MPYDLRQASHDKRRFTNRPCIHPLWEPGYAGRWFFAMFNRPVNRAPT